MLLLPHSSLQSNAGVPGAVRSPLLPWWESRSHPRCSPGSMARVAPGAALAVVVWQREDGGTVPAWAVRWQWLCTGSGRWHGRGGCFPECPAPVPGLAGTVQTGVPGTPKSFCCSQFPRASSICSPLCLQASRMLPRAPGGPGPLRDGCLLSRSSIPRHAVGGPLRCEHNGLKHPFVFLGHPQDLTRRLL